MTPLLRRRAHRIFHPLAGADLATLSTVLRTGGGVSPRHLHRVVTALGAGVVRAPLDAIERRMAARRAEDAGAAPPLFILGHWRSGTTHLLNLLSRDPRFATPDPLSVGLPWGFLGLSRFWRARLESWLPPDRIIDAMPVTPDAPQEDELALSLMQPLSYYHGIFFPADFDRAFRRGVLFEDCPTGSVARWRDCLAHYAGKLHRRNGGRRLVLKNPAHTAKIRHLRAVWPDAAFIHIHRNPYEVFASTRRMLRTLLREFALQGYDPAAVDALVLDLYPEMIARYDADASALPANRLVEIRYGDFIADPLGQLAALYDRLELGAFAPARPAVERYLGTVRDHRPMRHELDAGTRRLVAERWAFAFERWGYPR